MDMLERNMETFRKNRGLLYLQLLKYRQELEKSQEAGPSEEDAAESDEAPGGTADFPVDGLRAGEDGLAEQKPVLDRIETSIARDGSPVLTVEKGGTTYRLNSMYRPQAEAEKWCDQYAFQNLRMNILMFGMGNGIFVRSMLKRVGTDSKIFLYEPSMEIFFHVLSELDLSEYITNPNILFYFEGVNEKDFYVDLRGRTHWSNLSTQIDCNHPGYDKLFPKEYKKFRDWITECDVTEVVNRNTGVFFAQSLTSNALKNLAYVPQARQVDDYINAFPHDMPAIVVSAGPSLDKNIEELRRAEGKAFIMATDTAVRHLLEKGIAFDCMVTVDPKKPAYYMNLPECRQIPLICGLEANNEILDYHQGQKIWFRDSGNYLFNLYEKYKKVFQMPSTGGSVATSALSICVALHFHKVVLIGQDLAYGGEFTHAGGKVSHIKNEATTACMLEGIDGKPVKSRGDWKMYLDWFEKYIERLPEGYEVIDATEGGALIHGSTLMTLREVIDTYCKESVDIAGIFAGTEPSFSAYQKEIKADLFHLEKEFRNISYKAGQAAETVKKALALMDREPDSLKLNDYTREITKANQFIEKQNAYQLLDQYIESRSIDIVGEINVLSGDEIQDRRDTMDRAGRLYQVIIDAVEELEPEVKKAMDRIRQAG